MARKKIGKGIEDFFLLINYVFQWVFLPFYYLFKDIKKLFFLTFTSHQNPSKLLKSLEYNAKLDRRLYIFPLNAKKEKKLKLKTKKYRFVLVAVVVGMNGLTQHDD